MTNGRRPFGRRRRAVVTATLLLVMAAVGAPAAFGHAVIKPGASRPADLQQYTLTVPTERDSPTSEIELKVPASITFFLVEQTPGWETQIVRRNERIDEVHWTGEIPPDQYAVFRFIARNPVQEGELVWPVVQRYESGEVARWIGGPDSSEPASRTTISESAVPDDVVNVTGDGQSAAPTTEGAGETSSGGGRDGLTLAIAVLAAVGSLAAIAVSLMAWRGIRSAGVRGAR
jgi:uncharacterized protein YcnI